MNLMCLVCFTPVQWRNISMYVVDQPIHSGKKYAVSYIINYLNISVAIANFIRDLQKNTVLPENAIVSILFC